MPLGELAGQGWLQIGELSLAFLLSALIGVEREIRHKSAGLRTYTLIGFAAALIMLVSKYGFTNIIASDRIVLDPSRIAAQIVTGIGFIGGGLIFVHRDSVRGLTTAAIVWLTAAVGMACGAGLPILALFVTALHFAVVFTFPAIMTRLPRSRWAPSSVRVSYEEGGELLGNILVTCMEHDFAVTRFRFERDPLPEDSADPLRRSGLRGTAEAHQPSRSAFQDHGSPSGQLRIVTAHLEIQGPRSPSKLAAKLTALDGVVSVNAAELNVSTAE